MTSTSEHRPSSVIETIDREERGERLSKEEIVRLLEISSPAETERLYAAADVVRKRCVGDDVFLRGIVEFSNHCRQNCLYCGLRRDNTALVRYRMSDDEILASAYEIRKAGIGTIVLQSGEDPYYDRARLCGLIARIREKIGLVITLSVGERNYEDYRAFREAGADRYLLKHETSSQLLYERIRPGCRLEERLLCLTALRELNYEVGSGVMVGIPGQDIDVLADDIILLEETGIDMLGIGPFIPHPQTPFRDLACGSVELTLKVLAVARIVTRSTNIPATTALRTLDKDARTMALQAGANVIMPDLTPLEYGLFYDIYPGRAKSEVTDMVTLFTILRNDLQGIGRTIGSGAGHRRSSPH
ncbi:MAG: [FeFe] hydrogenase H-cluster radical SAM maturase HydE [Smithellaceae bacterium]|nr:[FeFe] hydrogenase H-cluster radical SAM maturase HydE [Smithellaceae bacterium]